MASSTCRPVPTARASRPSRAALASSATATSPARAAAAEPGRWWRCGGYPSACGGPLLVERLGGCPTPTTPQVTGRGPPPQLLRDLGQPRITLSFTRWPHPATQQGKGSLKVHHYLGRLPLWGSTSVRQP